MSTTQLKIARKRVHILDEVADDVMELHREAGMIADVEDLLGEALTVAALLKDLAAHQPSTATERTRDDVVRAHRVGQLLTFATTVFSRIVRFASAFEPKYNLQHLSDLRIDLHELGRLRQQFAAAWMLPDDERIATARQEIAAGKYTVLS